MTPAKDHLLGDNIDVGGVDGFILADHEDFAWCLTGKDITWKPTVVEGKQWHLIAVWTEQNKVSGHIDEDIWISGELDDFGGGVQVWGARIWKGQNRRWRGGFSER